MLTKNKVLILIGVSILIFLLVYTPHLVNPFPTHIDEWTHITQSIKLKQGEFGFGKGIGNVEFGFHIFLAFISLFVDLVGVYKFLPAIWAVVTALVLFLIVYNLTNKNFFIAVFSMLFLASLKSNVNITGIWFFIPLTFSIVFIYLYVYLFSEGIRQENKKMILLSLVIMLLLIPTHSISLLFAIPILAIYALINYKKSIKQYKVLLLFLIIPILGIYFFSQLFGISFGDAFFRLLGELQFKHGWGILELNNSPFEIYSFIGYIFAVIGFTALLMNKELREKYLVYLIWPVVVLVYIIIFRLTGVSYISPYQRNLYYFAISLPFLSAIGLYKTLMIIKNKIYKKSDNPRELYKVLRVFLIILAIVFMFMFYFSIPRNIKLYKVIDDDNYDALKFLGNQPIVSGGKVMAPASISTAMFSISGHTPVGTIFFYGNREDVDKFFDSEDCEVKNELIEKHNVIYVLSEKEINCRWDVIYNEVNNTIYRV